MAQVGWMPDQSAPMIGAVLLDLTGKTEVTRDNYEAALERRINRMVRATPPENLTSEAAAALQVEGLDLTVGAAGETMVEWSSELRARSGMEDQTFPIPVGKLKTPPALTQALKEEDLTLGEFLDQLYGG